jgi:alpha-tubulin suppressor-like RCC1 family protein
MTSTRHVRAALGALAPLCLAPLFACRDDATQVKVTIRTDLPCAQVRGRGTSITVGRADEDLEAKPAARVSFACDEQTRELGKPVFAPSGDDLDAAFAFKVVTAVSVDSVDDCAASGYEGCIVARRILRYVPQTTLYVDVSMDEACTGVVCDAATTCSGGACVPALIEDPARCERIGACSDRPPSDAGAGGGGGGAGEGGAGGTGGGGAGAGGEGGGGAGGEGGSAGGGPTVTVSKFSTGYNHTCALAAGGLQCWGQQGLPEEQGPDEWGVNGRDFGFSPQTQSDVPPNTAFIATGWQHACAGTGDLGAGFALKCFGGNERSVLGNTSAGGGDEPPTDIAGGGLWTQLAAGQVHACGIKGGDLLCWGSNDEGQRGIAPLIPPGDSDLSTISSTGDWAVLSAGAKHTCGIRKNSRLFCWGDNSRHQLGHDTDSPLPLSTAIGDGFEVPMPSNGLWVKVSAGTAHTCAIFSDSSLLCWGRNDAGQANPTPSGDLPAPTDVRNNLDWGDVAAGELHTCGISSDRQHLYCWGDNALGQLGNATPAAPGALTEVTDPEPGAAWDGVDAGGFHTCASKGSKLYCWGSNEFGQLGLGEGVTGPVPTPVPFDAR